MKLRLPKCLMILALAALPHAWAAAVIGSGVSYDNGKGSAPYSSDPDAQDMGTYADGGKRNDGLLCWANSASNLIQYWQDNYPGYVTSAAPDGFNEDVYTSPEGTRYLEIYEKFLEYSQRNLGGDQAEAFDWYFKNKAPEINPVKQSVRTSGEGAYTTGVFDNVESSCKEQDVSWNPDRVALANKLQSVFAVSGQAVGLKVWQQDSENLIGNSRNHAITCWGYETDGNGAVTALFLSDSDDGEFGVFKVQAVSGKSLPFDWLPSMDGIVLQSSDDIDGYTGNYVVNLLTLYSIDTPTAYAAQATAAPKLLSAANATEVEALMANTSVSGAVTRSGAGVKVGGANEAGVQQIVMLVSEDANSTLTLEGEGGGTGLGVEKGSLASLANLDVSGYEHGIDARGKVYLYGGDVSVGYNGDLLGGGAEVIDGAGIHNTNYVEISGSTSVVMELNAATGKGGGIYNADVASVSDNGSVSFNANIADQGGAVYNCDGSTLYIKDNKAVSFTYNRTAREGGAVYNKGVLSITGNGGVAFSGNTAASGNDIYNDGGKVNIAGNGGVQFLGTDAEKAAVVNNGELYLKSGVKEDGSVAAIRFDYSALDSRGGTTCVGRDMYGETSATNVYFTGKKTSDGDESMMILSANPKTADVAATLDHLKVNAWEIAGAGVGVSSLSNAAVATKGDIMVSGLRMESSVTLTSYAAAFGGNACITLNQVEIDLAGLSYVQTGNTYMYDLSGMFSGFSDMELTSVYLDASSVFEGVLAEGSRIEVNFGLGESALDIDKLAVLLGNGMMSPEMGFSGNNVVFYGVQEIPEPATGTLGLLALAGLCARRRRK